VKKFVLTWLLVCACAVGSVRSASAQAGPPPPPPPQSGQQGRPMTPPPAPALLRIFLDCNRCDGEYMRQEITFVDYMRDRSDADVHALVTTESTGGGGTAWTVKFIGLGEYQGQDRTVTFSTKSTDTEDTQRKEVARILKIGLIGYTLGTPAVERLNVTYSKPAATAETAKKKDPWNYWVFRLGTNGNLNGEESSSNKSYNFNANASRTTEAWKIQVYGNRRESRSSYDLGDGDIFKSKSSSWSSEVDVAKSAGPKLSFGVKSSASGSTYSNQDIVFAVMPAVEYNFFPYKENSRRSLTFSYAAGMQYQNYTHETVFSKLTETLPRHRFAMGLSLRQPWGSIYTSGTFTQQLNKLDRTNLSTFSEADVRLFKGFSFNIFGEYSRIRDQINLVKGDASTEDVLLRLRQLSSGYSYFMGFGVSYSFGSIFNTVVNPRFNNGG
jgi:hypothetical protein